MKKLLILPVLATLLVLPGCGVTTANGSHVGIVTAIEQNGLVFKTWDVYIKTDKSASTEDLYCVENPDVVSQIKEANKKGNRIEVLYHSEFIVAPWRCEGDTIIDNIKVLE